MLGEAVAALAGSAVVTAATTDGWEAVKQRFARLLGRGDADREQLAAGRLEETRKLLAGAADADLEPARAAQAERWTVRLADLLDENPGAEDELRVLVAEVQASLAPGMVSAVDHSVAAGRDVRIAANFGGVAAAIIHGNVTPGPTIPGAATS